LRVMPTHDADRYFQAPSCQSGITADGISCSQPRGTHYDMVAFAICNLHCQMN
jgi:hypothetical protein